MTITAAHRPVRARLSRQSLTYLGLLVLVLALVACGAVMSERFATTTNLVNVLRAAVVPLVIGLGQTVVVLIGAIDLSIGAVISLSGTLLAVLVNDDPGKLAWAVPCVLAAAVFIGVVNGLVITWLRVHSIIATLGTAAVIQGAALLLAERPVTGPIELEDLAFGNILGMPAGTLIALALYAAVFLVLQRTRLGRRFYAIGGNSEAARLVGLSTTPVICCAFAFSSFCAGLAGIYMVGLLGSGSPIMGQGYELMSITPVVLGGTLLSGGVGGIGGTLLAAVFVVLLNNLLNFMQVSTFYQWVVQGVIILVAVSTFSKKSKRA